MAVRRFSSNGTRKKANGKIGFRVGGLGSLVHKGGPNYELHTGGCQCGEVHVSSIDDVDRFTILFDPDEFPFAAKFFRLARERLKTGALGSHPLFSEAA